jgi:hypothetical protein
MTFQDFFNNNRDILFDAASRNIGVPGEADRSSCSANFSTLSAADA